MTTSLSAPTRGSVWNRIAATAEALESATAGSEPPLPAVMRSRFYLGQYELVQRWVDTEIDRTAGIPHEIGVIDWGAGNGHDAVFRHLSGDAVVATSLASPESSPYVGVLQQVTERLDVPLRLSDDPVVLPFDDASAAVVVGLGVLEHVHQGGGSQEASLAEINRVLVPRGAFVCAHLPSSRSAIEKVHRRSGVTSHDRLFSLTEVRSLAEKAGFEVARHTYTGAIPSQRHRGAPHPGWPGLRRRSTGCCASRPGRLPDRRPVRTESPAGAAQGVRPELTASVTRRAGDRRIVWWRPRPGRCPRGCWR